MIVEDLQIDNRFNLKNYKKRQVVFFEKNILIAKCKNKLLKITVQSLRKDLIEKFLPKINKKKCFKYFKYGIS